MESSKCASTSPALKKRTRQVSLCEDIPRYEASEFRLQQYLAAGNFGYFFRCFHDEVLGEVGVKIFVLSNHRDQQSAETEEYKKRLENVIGEANVMSRMLHSNVVQVLGVTSWECNIAIVMEFVDGLNLAQLVASSDIPISRLVALRISQEIACALAYLHNFSKSKTFCHGDLKPENIVLARMLSVKLADFGSAYLVRATGCSSSLDVPINRQHTQLYAAPELLENLSIERTASMDMYSFSMIVCELVTHEPVYADRVNHIHLLPSQIVSGMSRPTIPKVGDSCGSSPQDGGGEKENLSVLINIIKSCWNGDPSTRTTSEKVKQQIDKVLKKFGGAVISRQLRQITKILDERSNFQTSSGRIVENITLNNWKQSLTDPFLQQEKPKSPPSASVPWLDWEKTDELLWKFKKAEEALLSADQETGKLLSKKLLLLISRSPSFEEPAALVHKCHRLSKLLTQRSFGALSFQYLKVARKSVTFIEVKSRLDFLHHCSHHALQLCDEMAEKSRTKMLNKDIVPFVHDICQAAKSTEIGDLKAKALAVSLCLSNYACCLCAVGDYGQCVAVCREVLQDMRQHYGEEDTDRRWFIGLVYYTLAFSLEKNGQDEKAREFCRKSLSVFERAEGWNDAETKAAQIAKAVDLMRHLAPSERNLTEKAASPNIL